jgi:hypothetical protein
MNNDNITNEQQDCEQSPESGHKRHCGTELHGHQQCIRSGTFEEFEAKRVKHVQSFQGIRKTLTEPSIPVTLNDVRLSYEHRYLQTPKRREPILMPIQGNPGGCMGSKNQEFLVRIKRNENMNLTRESRIINARKERALRARVELESRAQFEREFKEAQMARMAFLMGSHGRLGRESPVQILNHDSLLELMARLSFS